FSQREGGACPRAGEPCRCNMLRSLSSRSRRSCIARSCDRAVWIGRVKATSTNIKQVARACDRVERLSIEGLLHPLESRGEALAALTVIATTIRAVARTLLRVLVGSF